MIVKSFSRMTRSKANTCNDVSTMIKHLTSIMYMITDANELACLGLLAKRIRTHICKSKHRPAKSKRLKDATLIC